MANFMEWLKEFQADNRERRQELIDEEVSRMRDLDIKNATSAMLEAGVEQVQIKELLIKYWDLRPSEGDSFMQWALEELITKTEVCCR